MDSNALDEADRQKRCENPQTDTCNGVLWTGTKWGDPKPPQTVKCVHCATQTEVCGGSTGIERCCLRDNGGVIKSCNETEFNKDIDCTETIVSGSSNGIAWTFNERNFFAATIGHIRGHANDEKSNRQTIVYEYWNEHSKFKLHSVLETPGAQDVEVFEIDGELFLLVAAGK